MLAVQLGEIGVKLNEFQRRKGNFIVQMSIVRFENIGIETTQQR